jgi:hypothetical protein
MADEAVWMVRILCPSGLLAGVVSTLLVASGAEFKATPEADGSWTIDSTVGAAALKRIDGDENQKAVTVVYLGKL